MNRMKRWWFSASLVGLLFSTILFSALTVAKPNPEPAADSPKVKLVTNRGEILLQLYKERAPKTVENFLRYVNEGHYDGTIFHRVIKRFMIQGGGFTKEYEKKKTHAPIKNEADNGLKNLRGTIAMARTTDPDSATAQFFINVRNNQSLDFTRKTRNGWGYTVFGHVIEGMDIVHNIERIPTGAAGPFRSDVPEFEVVIESAKIVE